MSDQPSTEAGRTLLALLRDHAPWFVGGSEASEMGAVLAIEAEARASERQRVEALRQAAETYFDATASEPLQGGPPPVAYIRARDANRRQARYELQLLLGRSEDTPRWWREHVASPTPEPRPAPLPLDVDEPTADHWLHALILHAEAVHGCAHTADARRSVPILAALTATEQETGE